MAAKLRYRMGRDIVVYCSLGNVGDLMLSSPSTELPGIKFINVCSWCLVCRRGLLFSLGTHYTRTAAQYQGLVCRRRKEDGAEQRWRNQHPWPPTHSERGRQSVVGGWRRQMNTLHSMWCATNIDLLPWLLVAVWLEFVSRFVFAKAQRIGN